MQAYSKFRKRLPDFLLLKQEWPRASGEGEEGATQARMLNAPPPSRNRPYFFRRVVFSCCMRHVLVCHAGIGAIKAGGAKVGRIERLEVLSPLTGPSHPATHPLNVNMRRRRPALPPNTHTHAHTDTHSNQLEDNRRSAWNSSELAVS